MKSAITFLLLFWTTCFAATPKLSFLPCTELVHPRIASGPAGVMRMAGDFNLFWPQNHKIRVAFLDGTKRQKAAAWKRFQQIDQLVNLTFTQVTSGASDIRVTFAGTSHWSYLGTECRKVEAGKPTMSLALKAGIFGDAGFEWNRTALHEICHSIGMIHEHQNPRGGIQWNVARVKAYYNATQGWTSTQTYQQVLARYSIDRVRGTRVDGTSIMMYPIPPELTMDGYSVGWNDKLSAADIWFLDQVYPVKGKPSVPKPPQATHEVIPPHYFLDGPAVDPDLLQIPGFGQDLRDRVCGGSSPSRRPGWPDHSEPGHKWAVPPTRLSCAWKEGKLRSHYLWLPGGRLLLQQGEIVAGYQGLI